MQDIIVGKESLSAHETMKTRMVSNRFQLNPLPFRCRVQRLVKLNFPNGSEFNQFMPNDTGALCLKVRAAAPSLPISGGGLNIRERQLTKQFYNRPGNTGKQTGSRNAQNQRGVVELSKGVGVPEVSHVIFFFSGIR